MKPIGPLMKEHRIIERVLDGLEVIARRHRAGAGLDREAADRAAAQILLFILSSLN